jgi:GTPase SAR1 family protein
MNHVILIRMDNRDLNMKLVVTGNSHVGKATLVRNLGPIQDDAVFSSIATTPPFVSFEIGDLHVLLSIWKSPRQESDRRLLSQILGEADIALVIFAINDPQSLNSLPTWVSLLRQYNPSTRTRIFLIGNKADLRGGANSITQSQGMEMQETLGCDGYIETSGRTCIGVDVLKTCIIQAVIDASNRISLERRVTPIRIGDAVRERVCQV